jgi:general secretion pathway protein K
VRRAIAGLLVEDPRLRWALDGRVHEIAWPDAVLRASVRPESAKIDLNLAPRELLMGLFANLLPESDADALADAVLLQRQGGEAEEEPPAPATPARRARGAEPAEPQPPKQAFATVDELVRVPGLGPTAVQRLRPYLSVHSGSAKVDVATADVEVLAAIPGVTRDAAQRFAQERTAGAAAGERLDTSWLGAAPEYVATRRASKVANIRAAAYLASGAAATVETVLKLGRGGGAMTVLDWREESARTGAGGLAE